MPDDLDVFILWEIFEAFQNKTESNNWEMARKYAKKINEHDIDKVYKRIKERLRKYCCDGIFFESKNGDGKPIYNMDLNMVTFIRHKFTDGYKMCLLLRI